MKKMKTYSKITYEKVLNLVKHHVMNNLLIILKKGNLDMTSFFNNKKIMKIKIIKNKKIMKNIFKFGIIIIVR